MAMEVKSTLNIFTIALIALVNFVSCTPSEELEELTPYIVKEYKTTEVIADFCTTPSAKIKTNLKFVFVIDQSGSNNNRPSIPAPGTDMAGERRYDPIISFIQNTPEDESIFYSLVSFSTAANIEQGFTSDKVQFEAAVEAEKIAINDAGWTNYREALASVRSVISADVAQAKLADEIVSSYYIVFFITDGIPMVGGGSTGSYVQDTNEILRDIDSITAISLDEKEYVDSIQVHSGYYFAGYDNNGVLENGDDPEARTLLSTMAQRSSGEFLEFSNDQEIDFTQFAIPERNIKNVLSDVIVLNMSTLWQNGILINDTDGDGLSDELEHHFNSNPREKDSDQNGISDLVEYRVEGTPCRSSSCSSSYVRSYSQCSSDDLINDKDGDFLTNCEEIILGSEIDSFDSNSDSLLDDIALRFDLSLNQHATNEARIDLDWDGEDNYTEIKFNTPYNFNNNNLYNLQKQKYELKLLDENDEQSCYQLKVDNLVELQEQSLFRIYVVERTSIINSKQIIRIAEKVGRKGERVSFSETELNAN